MKITRLLTMTIVLLNRRKVTAKELSEEFDVTERTIYRDIETLNSAGIPVLSHQGYEGGYSIPESYKVNKHLFTFDTLLSLLSTLKGVNKTLKSRDISDAIERLTALVPDDKEQQYNQKCSSFFVDIAPWGRGHNLKQLLEMIHGVVLQSECIEFSYSRTSGESRRVIEPYTLAYKGYGWYLLGFCRLRREFRVFKLQRMSSVIKTGELFIRKELNPEPYFSTQYDRREPINLVLSFNKSAESIVAEQFDPRSVEVTAESLIVRVSYPEDHWLYAMLLSFGSAMELLSPLDIREKLKQKIEKMAQQYRNLT